MQASGAQPESDCQERDHREEKLVIQKGLRCAFAVVLGAALLTPDASAQESYSWRMATGWGGGPLMEIGAQAFADRLQQLSGGRMSVEVFPGGAIGEPLKVTDSVRRGVADLGHTWPGYDWGRDTTSVLFGGFAGTMDDERIRALARLARRRFRRGGHAALHANRRNVPPQPRAHSYA